ncbi:MAG: PhoH family protein [Clostridia bacterium]|nr:PhoH family protein [Clostridia bacterium]
MAEKQILTDNIEQTAVIFGGFDSNAKRIEDAFDVRLLTRDSDTAGGSVIAVSGADDKAVSDAAEALTVLKRIAALNGKITAQNVDYVISMVRDGKREELSGIDHDCICLTNRGKPIKAKTVGQSRYVDSIRNNTIVFGVGPAGTGKTFLAVAMAVKALRTKQVSRIILTRPAVEAGEKLGFLPGDLQNKIDPYLRPLYDALYEMLGAETYQKYVERGVIEIAPLAYMRGRTLDDSFIILDEAQNTTPEQMKMFLTRLGFNSKAVVTGDITQTDLPRGIKSGLVEAIRILEGIEDIVIHHFTDRDVVRHRLVQRIIAAYEKYDKERAEKKYDSKAFRFDKK